MKEKPAAINNRRLTVALSYGGTGAPRVTAKGEGLLGEQIVELAREHGIPIQEDGQLSEALAQVPLGEEIPEALYIAVAEVLALAFRLSGRVPPGNTADD